LPLAEKLLGETQRLLESQKALRYSQSPEAAIKAAEIAGKEV
jgi:hypothetical protein